jgi:hypothetical protein
LVDIRYYRCFSEVDTSELVDAVIYLSYAAPNSFDTKFFEALQKPLSHTDIWVRLAAVWASGSIGWLEFHKILEELSVADPSGDVRQFYGSKKQLEVINFGASIVNIITTDFYDTSGFCQTAE